MLSEILKILAAEGLENSIISYQKGQSRDAISNLSGHIKQLKRENQYLKSKVLEREIMVLSDILNDLKKVQMSSNAGQKLIKATKERAINIQKGEVD